MADADNLHNQLEVILSAIKAYAATRQYYTTAEVAGKVEKNTFLHVEHHGVTDVSQFAPVVLFCRPSWRQATWLRASVS